LLVRQLYEKLDGALAGSTVVELRGVCAELGINPFKRGEKREALLGRVRAAQWGWGEEDEDEEDVTTDEEGDDVDLSLRIQDMRRLINQYGARNGLYDGKEVLLGRLAEVGGEGEMGLPTAGQRVRVFWEGEGRWFAGCARAVEREMGLVHVAYDDGDAAWEAFGGGSRTTWAYEDGEGEGEEAGDGACGDDGYHVHDGEGVCVTADPVAAQVGVGSLDADRGTPTAEALSPSDLPRGPLLTSPLLALMHAEGVSALDFDDIPSFGADVPSPSPPPLALPLPPPEVEILSRTRGVSDTLSGAEVFRRVAVQVLREAGTAMSPADIRRAGIERGLVRDDEAKYSLSHIPKQYRGVIIKVGQGMYGLAEWGLDDGGDADGGVDEGAGEGGYGDVDGDVLGAGKVHDDGEVRDDIGPLKDYGEPPKWSRKGIRGVTASLLNIPTPTAVDEEGEYAQYDDSVASDDDDLFGEERKWAMDLPDVISEALGAEDPRVGGQVGGTGPVSGVPSPLPFPSSCPLDLDVSPEEVVQRIDHVCEFLEDCVYEKQLPSISLAAGGAGAGAARPAFNMDNAAAVVRFSQLAIALDIIHENLIEYTDSRITQRDLYYIARTRDPSLKAPQFMQTVKDLSLALNVPRYAMGIDCRSKGLVFGPIVLPGGLSCMAPRGTPISGSVVDTLAIPGVNTASVTAIVVVEKETVFQRLSKEAPSHPILSSCVFITGCGYPDVGTRAFLHLLHKQDPTTPIVGVVDWNPHGAHILCQYRFGSARSLESLAFCVPVAWLGVRSATLERLVRAEGDIQFTDCTSRDLALAKNLRVRMHEYNNESWMNEIQCMEYGLKADVEALYRVCGGGAGFADLLGELIERREWI